MEGLISRCTSGTAVFLAVSNVYPTALIPLVVRRSLPDRGQYSGRKNKIINRVTTFCRLFFQIILTLKIVWVGF